jgi:hypothetical protein
MLLGELKRRLQDHLTDGLAIIVGSGLSAQLGIATMSQIASYLQGNPPQVLTAEASKQWESVCDELDKGKDLESALNSVDLAAAVEEHIVRMTAQLIEQQEYTIFQKAIAGHITLPLGELFRHLAATASSIPVITTNYDRLVELAADAVSLGVDSMFSGQVMPRFDPAMSREALGYAAHTRKRDDIQRKYRKHIRLFKPHGSVDWYSYKDIPVRSSVSVDLPRLMIAPGKTKFVRGYEQPFDAHRNGANEAVDRAARFLVLGFGFNDQQLETHLRPRIRTGRPCVIMTKVLTPSAAAVVRFSPDVLALSEGELAGRKGTALTTDRTSLFYPDVSLWNLATFLEEVLK